MAGIEAGAWRGRPVLVTGAGGFIGSWLAHRLVELGARVVALDIKDAGLRTLGILDKVTFLQLSILDDQAVRRALAENRIEVCFHLAAQALVTEADRRPAETIDANIVGTLNLLEAARELGFRLVVASSDKAYGDSPVLPYTEETAISGANCYDASKAAADVIAQSYARWFGLPVVIARCGNVYGGGDLNFDRIVPGTVRSLLNGQAPVIRSNGMLVRDYVYIDDVVEAYLLLGQFASTPGCSGEAFNFGTNHPMTVLEIVRELSTLMGRTDLPPVILNTASNEIEKQYLSSDKAARLLGWGQQVGIEEGLRRAIDWYKGHLGAGK